METSTEKTTTESKMGKKRFVHRGKRNKNKQTSVQDQNQPQDIKSKKSKISNSDENTKLIASNRSLADSPPITDPATRLQIHSIIENRNLCTVCIGNLPRKCSFQDLKELAPDIKSCIIPWNKVLRISKSIAFLEFDSETTAENQKKLLDGKKQWDKTICVHERKNYPDSVDVYNCHNVTINNLPKKVTKGEISRIFPKATDILLHRSDSRSPGRCSLEFSCAKDAIEAILLRQGYSLRHKNISVMFQKKIIKNDDQKKCLFLLGVQPKTTEQDLRAVFPQATSININRLQGSAYLFYSLSEDCDLDFCNSKGVSIRKHKIRVYKIDKRAPNLVGNKSDEKSVAGQPFRQKIISTRVFVKNLPRTTKEGDLKNLFTGCKSITVSKRGDQCSGHAFVDYETGIAADQAIKMCNGKSFQNRKINCSWAVASVKSMAKENTSSHNEREQVDMKSATTTKLGKANDNQASGTAASQSKNLKRQRPAESDDEEENADSQMSCDEMDVDTKPEAQSSNSVKQGKSKNKKKHKSKKNKMKSKNNTQSALPTNSSGSKKKASLAA